MLGAILAAGKGAADVEDHGMLESAIAILLVAVVVVSLAPRLKVSPVVGYLVAGAILGPAVTGLMKRPEEVAILAELGVVFLLFGIGLELSFERLRAMRSLVFGLGGLQVLATGTLFAVLARLAGVEWPGAVILGGALALSSTAFVLQLLAERGEQAARFARVAFAILLLQDLAVLPLLALVPALAGGSEGGLFGALARDLGWATLAVAVTLLAGRYLLRPLFRHVAASGHRELLVATALLVVLGAAYGMTLVGLSMALGALLAGLLLSGTEYRHQVEADLRPFRGLFLGFFFLYVGMTAELEVLVAAWYWVLGGALALMALKALLLVGFCLAFRQPLAVAISVGGYLAQGGEFAFVLLATAKGQGLLGGATVSVVMAVVVLTLLLTPLSAALARGLSRRVEARRTARDHGLPVEPEALSDHVLIAGFGRVGQTVAQMANAQGLKHLGIDLDPQRVAQCRRRDLAVFFGDASRYELLEAAGAGRARAVVVTLDKAGQADRLVAALTQHHPDLPVYVRARDLEHAAQLRGAGATVAVPEAAEGSLQLGASLLQGLGQEPVEVDALLARLRAEGYAALAGGRGDRTGA